jgi:hypothetical protein
MSARYPFWHSLRFLLGILLLMGNLLVFGLLLLVHLYFPLLLYVGAITPLLLLLLPTGGLLLGIWLIMRSNEPLWFKLLVLFFPVLLPVFLFLNYLLSST